MNAKEYQEAMKARLTYLLMESAKILFRSVPDGPAAILVALDDAAKLFTRERQAMHREYQEALDEAEAHERTEIAPRAIVPARPHVPHSVLSASRKRG